MVLLTYQDPEEILKSKIEKDKRKDASGSVSEKDEKEDPISPYIDDLFKFKESEANGEKCDLFFLCNDGEVGAHRLVISNASNYIMTMQQDTQSPWNPVYISVPDFNMELIQCLVKLAYTGQMILPPTYSSEDLIDAMQALGWVSSDLLTASYTDSTNLASEDDAGEAESTSTSTKPSKMSFPKIASDDEEGMEMDLPSVPLSDEDEKSPTIKRKKPSRTAPTKTRGGRQIKGQNKPKVTLPREIKASPVKPKRQRSNSPTENLEQNAQSDPITKPEPRKRGTKTTNGNDNEEDVGSIPSQAETETPAVASPEAVRSRTRTIRKPKKFDDLIVLTPTKRKESPSKSPTKAVVKPAKDADEEKNSKKATKPLVVSTATSSTNKKPRRSTSIGSDSNDASKNSLITSYFSKRSPRKSDDHPMLANSNEFVNDCDDDSTDTPPTHNHRLTGSAKNERTNSKDEKEDILQGAPSKSTLRNRAKSTASAKSDKDSTKEMPQLQEEGDSSKPAVRRKRNLQGGTPAEDTGHPSRRMRQSSTVSNSSNKST